MTIQQINIEQMKLHRDYIYDTIMFIANRATGLNCYVERKDLNRPDSTYISMDIETMNPLGYYSHPDTGEVDIDGNITVHEKRYIHYQTSLTINTWKQDANAFCMAIQAALKSNSAIEFMRDRNVGWLSESSIFNNSTVLDKAYEERASILIQLNSYIGDIDPSEFEYINSVDITGNIYTCEVGSEPVEPIEPPTVTVDVVLEEDCYDPSE